MTRASGLQIAFLILAVEFFAMLLSRQPGATLALPDAVPSCWGNAHPSGRRADPLRPSRRSAATASPCSPGILAMGRSPEVLSVALGNCAIPFAVVGAAAVLEARLPAPPGNSPPGTRFVDPAEAWAWTLSPAGSCRMLVLLVVRGPGDRGARLSRPALSRLGAAIGLAGSLALTSGLFGLSHPTRIRYGPRSVGRLICVLRRTGSLRACIVVHMALQRAHLLATARAGTSRRARGRSRLPFHLDAAARVPRVRLGRTSGLPLAGAARRPRRRRTSAVGTLSGPWPTPCSAPKSTTSAPARRWGRSSSSGRRASRP